MYNEYAIWEIISTMLVGMGIIIIVGLVFAVLMIIGKWKCFKKAGYNGWESLIGGHEQFVNCTFAGVNPILVLAVIFGSVVTIVPVIGGLAYIGFLIYYQFLLGINTAKAFGKGTGFGVALAIPLSAPIAWFILGKDDSVYVGVNSDNVKEEQNVQMNSEPVYEQPVQQPVYEQPTVVPVMPTPQVEPIMPQPETNNVSQTFCTNCGNALIPGTNFCTRCGTKI